MGDVKSLEQKGLDSGGRQGYLYRAVLTNNLESPRFLSCSSSQGRSIESISIGRLSATGSQFTATTITETASELDDGVGMDSGDPCAWGRFRPNFLQRFRNPKIVLFFLCLVAVVQGMVINGFVSVVISTIERRFDLTSVESGLIASGYDIACVLCLMPVSYFGGVAHKPRWIGTGVFLLGLGSFLFSLPHFTAGSYNYESSQESNICHRNSPQVNFTLQQSRHSDLETCDRADHQISPLDQPTSLSNFKYILFMAQLLHGVGATPIFTLAVTYLDDNLKAKMTPMYVGTFYAMAIVGPAIGYVVGGELLELFCDIGSVDLNSVTISFEDPQWVGAWWIGFIFSGFLACLLSIFLCGFPKSLPGSAKLHANRVSEAYRGSESATANPGFGLGFKDIPASIKLLLTNPTFMALNMAGACEGLLISGFTVFAPKFIESQFSISAAWAAKLIGFATIPAGGGGTFVGGYLVKRLDLHYTGILKMCMVTTCTALILTLSFLARCPNVLFAGVNVDYAQKNMTMLQSNLTSDCNKLCHCAIDRYDPVCGLDGVTYFSPCFAGCSASFSLEDRKVYYNCSCVIDHAVISSASFLSHVKTVVAFEGKCMSSCHLLSIFLPIFALIIFFTFVTSMPALSATLRCVPDKQRSFALGIQWILVRCLGNIPAPILFGALIDKTCQSWQETCQHISGSCFIYDNWTMGSYLLALVFCFKGLSLCFFALAYLLYKAPNSLPTAVVVRSCDDRAEDESLDSSSTQMMPTSQLNVI